MKDSADRIRRSASRAFRASGSSVVRAVFALDSDASDLDIRHTLATAYCNTQGDMGHVKQLDFCMKQSTDTFTDSINK